MGEQQFVGSVFIAINSYRRAASNGLEVLPRVDEAIRDFVSTFYSLRFKIEARWDCTADEFRDKTKEFLEGFKAGGRTSGKYAVFVFVGHGGGGDVLYTEDGKTVSTEEVVKSFAAELPKTVLKMFFIDACRRAGGDEGVPYCPVEEKCLLARSALPYQAAWTKDSYGLWSKALSKQLLSSATVQSALTAVCNSLKQRFDLPEHHYSQHSSYGFPEVAWIADVEYEGGFRGSPALEDLRELTTFRIELERYREAKAQEERQRWQRQIQTSVLRLPSNSKDILQHMPTLDELVQLVITSVAYKWEDIAIFLDINPTVTDNIKATDRNTSEDHCKEMLKHWLRTTVENDAMGKLPRTWKSIFHAVSNSSGTEVTKDIERQLFPDITPEDLERMPSLKLLRCHVIPRVTAQWQRFGLFLGIDQAKLDALAKPNNHHGVTVWCEEMFKLWLKGESDTGDMPRTWEAVLGAITDAIGGMVAKEIERKLRDPDVDIN